MAETAEVFALRQKVRDLRGQLHSRDKALRLKREEFIPKEVANMEAHYARLWKSLCEACLLYTSPSPRDRQKSRMPSSA